MSRHRPLRHRTRRLARALSTLTAMAVIWGASVPAGASVRVSNFAVGTTSVGAAPTTHAYWSGSSTTFETGRAWRLGAMASTAVDTRQGLVESQTVAGAVSVTASNAGLDWGRAWSIPGAQAGSATSVAVDTTGIVAVAAVTSVTKSLVVTRQVAPGIWASIPTWVAVAGNVRDAEITFTADGLLSVAYVDDTSGAVLVRRETAVGTWGATSNLGGRVIKVGIAIAANGMRMLVAIGFPNTMLWFNGETATGVWTGWAVVCSSPSNHLDTTMMINGNGQVHAFQATAAGIYSCQYTGTRWTNTQVKTGSYTTVSAARLVDGRTLLSATSSTGGLATTTGDAAGSAASWSGWSGAVANNVADHEVDAYDAGNDLRLAATGTTTYAPSGTWTSPAIDTGGNGAYGLLRWRATTPVGTDVTFQVAASNGDPTDFVGPDGTAATRFTANHPGFAFGDAALPYALDGKRFLRVRATLTGTGAATPILHAVGVNYRLPALSRSAGGRFGMFATAAPIGYLTRTTAATASAGPFAAATSTLRVDASSSWNGTSGWGAFDTAAPSCCSPAQFDVASGVATATGAGGVAPIASSGTTGQSVVLGAGGAVATADLTVRTSLSSSLHWDLPIRAVLSRNVARAGTASQSSTWNDAGCCAASQALDGNLDGNYWARSITTTGLDAQPWWSLDLGARRQLFEIRLFNRSDCCADRLSDFVVLTSPFAIPATSFDTAVASVHASGGQVRFVSGAAASLRPFVYPPGTSARYVQVMLRNRAGYLSLAEVEVYGA